MNRSIVLLLAVGLLAFSSNALAQFSSGSTGAQGPFPPTSLTGLSFNTLTIDLKTGIVSATSGSTPVGTATLPGGAQTGDSFPTGDLDFTTFSVSSGKTLKFLPNTLNTPVSIRTTGDVTITGTIDLKGERGVDANGVIALGGKGNVGGASGGQGGYPAGTGVSETAGSPGLGRSGGAGGAVISDLVAGSGKGGTFPSTNLNLLPLVGGSGGGGGRGAEVGADGRTGSGGGGGGGAILIASSTKIAVTGSIDASGGGGGGYYTCLSSANGGGGGGGSGGAIRLISNRVEISGSFRAQGGSGICSAVLNGGPGVIQLETFDLVVTGAQSSPRAALGEPGVLRPVNLPRLRISSVGGISVPDTQIGVTGTVNVQFPTTNPPTNPMAVVVAATSIPDGTTITVSLKPASGAETTATAALATASGATTATVNMTVPSGISYIQAFSATFTLSAELQGALPLFNGEKILTAAVEFDGERDHTYFFTASGHRVSAETLLASR